MTNDKEPLSISNTSEVLAVQNACLTHSRFVNVSMDNVKITNADLSNLEIDNAQIGGAYIHNVGVVPPKGHPAYDPAAKHNPLRFENCDLHGSTLTDCNLSGVGISDCNITGMKINGIAVEELLKAYQQKG